MNPKLAFVLPISLALTLDPAEAAVRYVNMANPSPATPFTNWLSAATDIQDAIDVADLNVALKTDGTLWSWVPGELPQQVGSDTDWVRRRELRGPPATRNKQENNP